MDALTTIAVIIDSSVQTRDSFWDYKQQKHKISIRDAIIMTMRTILKYEPDHKIPNPDLVNLIELILTSNLKGILDWSNMILEKNPNHKNIKLQCEIDAETTKSFMILADCIDKSQQKHTGAKTQ